MQNTTNTISLYGAECWANPRNSLKFKISKEMANFPVFTVLLKIQILWDVNAVATGKTLFTIHNNYLRHSEFHESSAIK